MPPHPLVRAYMAGVVVPTVTVFAVAIVVGRYFSQIPAPIERAMIFPMAINPLLWGVWNALYIVLQPVERLSLGWHGAVLPLLLIPAGVVMAHQLDMSFVTTKGGALVLVPTMVAYFVLWKYVVGFLNGLVGLSD